MNAPTTSDFLPEHAFPADDERVQRQMTLRISFYMRHPELIGIRLRQLDREWNIERFMEKKTAALAAVDTSIRSMRSKRWFTLAAPVTNLLQNTVQGWILCPFKLCATWAIGPATRLSKSARNYSRCAIARHRGLNGYQLRDGVSLRRNTKEPFVEEKRLRLAGQLAPETCDKFREL